MRVCGSAGTLILGEHTYKDLAEMHAAGVTVDMVDVFQRADRVRLIEGGEREQRESKKERERERCANAHMHTRTHPQRVCTACTLLSRTHTQTHTHTQVGPIADDAIKIGAKVLWLQLAVRNAGLFCLCNRSLLPLY